MTKHFHPFHLVIFSPWPLITGTYTLFMMSGMVIWFQEWNIQLSMMSIMGILISCYMWWRDVSIEATYIGDHTKKTSFNMKLGMMLFIVSEVLFFFSFFWTFFHVSLSPNIEIGSIWPPKLITPFNPVEIPLLNTIILLSSGAFATWSHHELQNKNKNFSIILLFFTIMLGIMFTSLQLMEYMESPFKMADSIFSSTFFLTTGFHGFHVIIGSLFLFICLLRMQKNHYSSSGHVGYELSLWYWHFVDVVWLFLYTFVYMWST